MNSSKSSCRTPPTTTTSPSRLCQCPPYCPSAAPTWHPSCRTTGCCCHSACRSAPQGDFAWQCIASSTGSPQNHSSHSSGCFSCHCCLPLLPNNHKEPLVTNSLSWRSVTLHCALLCLGDMEEVMVVTMTLQKRNRSSSHPAIFIVCASFTSSVSLMPMRVSLHHSTTA